MKLLAILIMLAALFLLYRIVCPKQVDTKKYDKTPLSTQSCDYEAVVKSRFVLPDRSNLTIVPVQDKDSRENPENRDKKPDTFAAGNENPPSGIIQPEELNDVFGEDVNPEDLDIERDENETDENDASDLDADEEAEEIRGLTGETEGYAGGFTYEELTTVIHETDKPDEMTKASVETLHNLSGTDMFEELVSGDKSKAARIAAILDRNEKSLIEQSEDAADGNDSEYQNYDIDRFLS
jgi:hypothetical protein